LKEADMDINQGELVSFIIPCYCESEIQFRQSIESVINQTYQNLDIVIILDNPENELLLTLGQEYARKDERVRFIVNEKNLGLTKTLNKGIHYVKGELIARLDADDIALPNRIEEQIKYISEHDLVSTNFSFINESNEVIQDRHFPETDDKIKYYMLHSMDCMFHTTWLGKKSLFEKLNGYRDIGPFEDYDFLLRGIKIGAKYYNIQQSLTQYRINMRGISQTNKVLQHLGSEFLRDNFNRIEEIRFTEILRYLESISGQKKIKEFNIYDKIKEEIFSAHNKSEFYIKAIRAIPKLFFNYYGRKKMLDLFKYR